MPGRVYYLIATLVGVCILAAEVRAEEEILPCAESLYAQGDYLAAIAYIEPLLADTLGLSRDVRLPLLRLLGSSYVAVGNTESAKRQFTRLLTLDPGFQLEPLSTSPKIIAVFGEAKREFDATHAAAPAETLSVESLSSERRTNVWVAPALKSFCLPGLGQFQNGHQTKGVVFLSSQAVSVAGLLVSQVKHDQARSEYANNRDITRMDHLYKEYNKWYMVRNGFIASTIGICLVSSVDAIIGAFECELGNGSTTVGFVPSQNGFYACLVF